MSASCVQDGSLEWLVKKRRPSKCFRAHLSSWSYAHSPPSAPGMPMALPQVLCHHQNRTESTQRGDAALATDGGPGRQNPYGGGVAMVHWRRVMAKLCNMV